MNKILTLLMLMVLSSFVVTAQSSDGWDDSGSDGWDDNGSSDGWDDNGSSDGWDDGTSTGMIDGDTSGSDDGWDDDGWGDDGGDWGGSSMNTQDYVRSSRPTIEAKPYERFTGMPYDSATELVTYVEIVEVIIPDKFFDLAGEPYDTPDSLQARAMDWLEAQFGKKELKKMIEMAGIDEKGREGNTINALMKMPLNVKLNKYSTVQNGELEFDMELRFKEGRYRYKFENFVHVSANTSGGKDDVRTYMEYYMTAKRDIRSNDKVLMACNDQMNELIEGLKATCAAVPFLDDDDW